MGGLALSFFGPKYPHKGMLNPSRYSRALGMISSTNLPPQLSDNGIFIHKK
jgi:hypothetical protein